MKRIERRWWMTERPRHYAFTGPRRAQARSNRRHQPARHGDEGQRPARSDCHATELQRPAGGGPEQLDQADHWPLPRRLGRPGSRDQHPGTPSSVGPRHGRLPRARPRMRNQPDPGRGRTDSSSNRHVQLPRVLRQQRLTRFLADELATSHGTHGGRSPSPFSCGESALSSSERSAVVSISPAGWRRFRDGASHLANRLREVVHIDL
jgi:hypothetical protein